MEKKMNAKRGFSLIEIIIFCFIAITLLTLFVGLAINSREFAKTVGCVNNMKTIAQAVENFQADYKTTPTNLSDLYPQYVTNEKVFKCPADRTVDTNSYEKYYIGRFIASEKANNVFLACPRHHRKNKTVAAYLSYAVDIGRNKPVQWSGTPADNLRFPMEPRPRLNPARWAWSPPSWTIRTTYTVSYTSRRELQERLP